MRSTAARVALGAALVIVAVVLFAVLQGDDDGGGTDRAGQPASGGSAPSSQSAPESRQQKPARPPVQHIVVRDGAPVGGPATIRVKSGERVRFRVSSDVAEEVHVHGYDVTKEIPAGGTATVSFDADLEGIYEVEMHGSGALIAELRVEP